jgi:cysteine desulfurase family protein
VSALVYLDQAATSFPKPPEVLAAVRSYLEDAGGSPGRSGHRLSAEAARRVFAAREAVAGLLGVGDPRRLVFTPGATAALNLALAGTLRPGDHVLLGPLAHNAVARPLRRLRERLGLEVTALPCDAEGLLDPDVAARARTPRTRLLILTHASNATGALQPVREIKAAVGDLPVLLDAAQSAGSLPLEVDAWGLELVAFTGHKALLGLQGTGGLALGPGVAPEPLMLGGTGSRSESDEQPDFLPDRYESGTPNGPGLAGLGAGATWVRARGVAAIHAHELALCARLRAHLEGLPGVRLLGPRDPARRSAIVSLALPGHDLGTLVGRLDREHGVLVRAGLHCAPLAHRAAGTFPAGALRLAPGPLTTAAEVDLAAAALVGMLTERPA